MDIDFIPPGFNGGLPITNYEYSLDSGSTWTPVSPAKTTGPIRIPSLSNGTKYSVSLRAVNALGGGDSGQVPVITNDLSTTPFTVPAKITSISLTAGNSNDTFSWTAPADNGRSITKYRYQVSSDNGANWYSAIGGTLNGETEVTSASAILATQYKLSSYKIRIKAYNEAGWSDYSDISTSATVAWAYTDYINQTVSETQACTSVGCGSCGTQAQQKVRSKEQRKYRYTRSGSTSSAYDANWSDYTSYADWSTISCANTGSCVETSWVALSRI